MHGRLPLYAAPSRAIKKMHKMTQEGRISVVVSFLIRISPNCIFVSLDNCPIPLRWTREGTTIPLLLSLVPLLCL